MAKGQTVTDNINDPEYNEPSGRFTIQLIAQAHKQLIECAEDLEAEIAVRYEMTDPAVEIILHPSDARRYEFDMSVVKNSIAIAKKLEGELYTYKELGFGKTENVSK